MDLSGGGFRPRNNYFMEEGEGEGACNWKERHGRSGFPRAVSAESPWVV